MLVRLWSKNPVYNLTSRIMAKRPKTDKHFSGNETHSNIVNETESHVNINQSNMFPHILPPIKSYSDNKEYAVIQLPNGMRALLISDKSEEVVIPNPSELEENYESDSESSCEEDEMSISSDNQDNNSRPSCDEKLAACALCIGVGSFSDPENIPGLAHFLEHMIFMGSDKFPRENAFDAYIKKKGGSDNATTECEYTTFYFDCHESYLLGAMEIFSQLFISPLMKRDSMTKEREAIESEFQMSLPSDESRRSQIFCSLADKNNPAHKFMWGNLITLRDNVTDDDLYSALHKFRERHYSAHRMTLAVQARLPIETLEKWVVDCFQNVPNNGLPPEEFSLSVPPFKEDEFSKLYVVEPVNDINQLHLTWVMPSTLKMYKTKPLGYLSWVIGHEGKGSLHSLLRKRLWSIGINVNDNGDGTEDNSLYTLFSISFTLTQEGIQHIEEVLNLTFAYLKMFQDVGPQERLFTEMQMIAETSFRYTEEVSSSNYVEHLSENMHLYPSTDYITGPELYLEYDQVLIKSFLMKLRPDNVNIMVSSKELTSKETLELIEPWFGTKYQSKEIPSEWITNWETVKGNQEFFLPEENQFIATDFTVLPTPDQIEEFPVNIIKDNFMELWHKQDVTFMLPHGFCCLHLVSPLSYKTPENAAMLDLFISIVKQHFSEELYPANVAELEYALFTGEKGIMIAVNGLNEKLNNLLSVIIDGMKSLCCDLNPNLALAMKEELRRAYSNSNLKTSYLVRDIRMSILLETYWTALEKENALKNVTYESLKEFLPQYFECLYIQFLFQGNFSKEEAVGIASGVKHKLSYKPLLENTTPRIRVYELPPGERFCVVHSFSTEDANSVVTNYYQSGLGTIEESCIIEMLLMIMEEPLFDSLRTQQQLGYDVSCSLRETFGILGYSVSVHCQTDRNSVELVESRITQFLQGFLDTLKKTTQAEFEEVQDSLIKLKKCKDVHLKEEVQRNWREIKCEDYIFDRHLKESDFIKKLTLEEVIDWFGKVSGLHGQPKLKKLSTQVVGKASSHVDKNSSARCPSVENKMPSNKLNFIPQQEATDKFIISIKDFKKSLYLYPCHKIT